MSVVADTSPINYLILIGELDLLRQLYSEVLIPPAAESELLSPHSPAPVRLLMSNRPAWLSVVVPVRTGADPRLTELDAGEREAIHLALEGGADRLLIDERDGRRVAQACGVVVTGTLRVLADAAEQGLVSLSAAFGQLRGTSFRVSPKLMASVLQRDRAAKP